MRSEKKEPQRMPKLSAKDIIVDAMPISSGRALIGPKIMATVLK